MIPPPLKATKWLSHELLLSFPELQRLFEALQPFTLYFNGGLVEKGKAILEPASYLETYKAYIEQLKSGHFLDPLAFRQPLTALMSRDPETVAICPVGEGKELVRVIKPSLQLFEHVMSYKEGRFHSMVHGKDTISWGIIFTYPQLYENPKTLQPEDVMKDPTFQNTLLFRSLQRWMRKETVPVPLIVEGKKKNLTARIGKECLSWVENHPQLKERGIHVDN